MRVSLFVTCLADQLWPSAAVGAVGVLRRRGWAVEIVERLACCGPPAINTGCRPAARSLARRQIEIFESSAADAIVSPSGSCTAMVHHYDQLFDDSAWRARARGVADRTHELSSFLVNQLGVEDVGASFPGRLTWHDACHGLRDLGIKDEPRRLLRRVKGAELVELPPPGRRDVLRLRRNVFGEVPRDLGGHARREGGRHRAGRRGRRGVGRRELPDADRRAAVAPRVDGPRPAPGGRVGVHMTFERDARTALADGQLRGALRRATTLFGERRRAALATVPDWEGARDRARAIKDETLEHLDRYLEQFTANPERAGARVHWARDAAEACDIIGGIAERRGARTVVKSKSMATEEIHLNAALARRGIEPVETDLGEYIVQLAGETPSHIVAPAIHKTRAQIAALFADKLGIAPSDDIATLTGAARAAF